MNETTLDILGISRFIDLINQSEFVSFCVVGVGLPIVLTLSVVGLVWSIYTLTHN